MHGWAVFFSRDSHGKATAAGNRAGCSGRRVASAGLAPALALLLVSGLAFELGVGCAARRPAPAPVPASVPSPRIPGQTTTPIVLGTTPSGASSDAFPPLPGTNRVYPSQDPRNVAPPDAPEAFPLTGAVAGSAAKSAVAESVAGDFVAESVAGDPAAGSIAGDPVAESVAGDPGAELLDQDPTGELVAGETSAESAAEDTRAGGSVAASPPAYAVWSVQLLASSSLSVARERAGGLARYFPEPPRVEPVGGLFKVRVGAYATRGEAEALRRKALKLGLRDAFVVPPPADGEPPRWGAGKGG